MPARTFAASLIVVALIAGSPALAGTRRGYDVPAGPLPAALAALARQARIDIGGSDAGLARLLSPGVTGARSVAAALKAVLAGTPFIAEAAGADTWRIVRRPLVRRAAPRPPAFVQPVDDGEIVVTGGKRDVPLASYPGSAVVVRLGESGVPRGSGGQAFLLRQTPILQSTELGTGRNKLFIRGIADSSFTGPTQSTAGTYFGDVRTGYNGPDPNLNLYDVDQVEVLEGPQGALYGAGSIGGVIRLSPRPARTDTAEASIDTGISTVAHGGVGYDVAAMANYVPVPDRIGLRVVAYRSVDSGYIDDPGRHRSDINRVAETGVRATARVRPATGWTIDAGFLTQHSRQPDLQYTLIEEAPLTRRSATAQPFSDDYKLGRLVIVKDWDSGLHLVSATGRVVHDTRQRYDATRPGFFANPIAYDERNRIRLTTQEVRLSRYGPNGSGWLIGASLVRDSTVKSRRFGTLVTSRDLIGVANRTDEKAAFVSGTVRPFGPLLVTGGVRVTDARQDGDPSVAPTRSNFIRGRSTTRADPQFSASARIAPRLVLFGQYQQGFRTGGLAVARGIGRVANYEEDRIYVGEAGLRLVRHGPRGLAGVAAVSYARWYDIQADLVSIAGFPYTANVGDGRVAAFEGSLDWVPIVGVRATAGLFVNRSRLIRPAPDFLSSGSRPLPDTPPVATTAALAWSGAIAGRALTLSANGRYVGRSRLGVGPVLDLPYGNYAEFGAAASLRLGGLDLSLTIDNLLDTRGNRFAIGNPFGVAYRDEETPLRPRTVRLGAKAHF